METSLRNRCAELEEALAAERERCARLELQANRNGRMAALGEMATGLAHDFNNMLTPIMGAAQLALEEVPADQELLREDLEMVLNSAERAGALVRQMIQYGRDSRPSAAPLDARTLLRDAVTLIRAALPKSVEVRQAPRARPLVMADATRLRQSLISLAHNLVSSAPVPPRAVLLELTEEQRRTGPSVCYRIHLEWSQGPTPHLDLSALDPESLLHLAIGEQGGELSCADGVVTVRMPRYTRTLTNRPTSGVRPAVRRLTALVVDDDPDVAQGAAKMLRALSLRTVLAPSAEAAAARLASRPNEADLLVIGDSPGARALALEAAARLRPDMRVVVLAQPDEPREALAGHTVIEKPFGVADLNGVLSDSLQEEADALAMI